MFMLEFTQSLPYPNRAQYQQALGLSCIENHVLAILAAQQLPFAACYTGINLSLHALWDAAVEQHTAYADFNGVPRVQDVLKDAGCIFLKRHTGGDIVKVIESAAADMYLLLQVTPAYAKQTLRSRGWRADHYVLAKQEVQQIRLFNDIPAVEETVSKTALKKIYGGTWFTLYLDKNKLHDWLAGLPFVPVKALASTVPFLNLKSEDMPYFRDMVGLYRILKRRQRQYYAAYFNTEFLDEEIKQLDMIYLQIEFSILKKEINQDTLQAFIETLQACEAAIQIKLNQEIKQ